MDRWLDKLFQIQRLCTLRIADEYTGLVEMTPSDEAWFSVPGWPEHGIAVAVRR